MTESTETPLDALILTLSSENLAQGGDPDMKKKKVFVLNQIQFLRVLYILMKQINIQQEMTRYQGQESLTLSQLALERPISSHAVFLHYFTLVNVLNQFGRAFEKHHGLTKPLPRYERIRFYRNKVLEHWDDYTTRIPSSGYIQQGGKLPIPMVETVYLYPDRVTLQQKLLNCFRDKGIEVNIDSAASGQSTSGEYCNSIYEALEKIDSSLWKNFKKDGPHEDLIKLLFEFGFPAPIVDVDEYLSELVPALESCLA